MTQKKVRQNFSFRSQPRELNNFGGKARRVTYMQGGKVEIRKDYNRG